MAPTIKHHGGHSWTPSNQRWDQVPGRSYKIYFVKKNSFLCHFWSRKHDVIKLSIADISLIVHLIESQFGHRDEASRCDIDVIYNIMWPWSMKRDFYLHVYLDLWGQLQGKRIFFLYRWMSPYITPSILDWITTYFQRWFLKKRNFRLHRYYVINIFRLAYLRCLLSDWAQTNLSQIRLIVCICILTWYVMK